MRNISTRDQKIFLNIMLIAAFIFICLLFLIGLFLVWHPENLPGKDPRLAINVISVQVGISIILIWFMIFLPYLAWAVYFYNINLGKTNEEWEVIKRKNAEREYGEEEIAAENPYKNETFGLPKGTIRGSIAITLMVGALSMFIVAIGHPTILRTNEFFHENFEFFKTAFLMMIAFYFGGKSLEYLRERWTVDTGSPGNPPQRRQRHSRYASDEFDEEPAEDYSLAEEREDNFKSDRQETLKGTHVAAADTWISKENEDEASDLHTVMTEVHLIPQNEQKEIQKELSEDDIREHAKALNIEVAALKAVIDVESAGKGFLKDGRPKILFEGHIFWNQLTKAGKDPAQIAVNYPELVYPRWTKQYYKGGAAEYQRLNAACLIHDESAKKSTSWGMFQIMGFNHKACGYDTVQEFVEKMSLNENVQMEAFTKFCESKKLLDHLRVKNWVAFAKSYNGPGYAQNQYDYKLEMKYHLFSRKYNDKLSVKITREDENTKQTVGTLTVYDGNMEVFSCKTLELPWRNNQRNISCIPASNGTPYTVVKRWTEERKDHFHILNVPQRSAILIHSGNYYTHTLGCVLVGKDLTDLNKDGYADVTNSKVTLNKLTEILPDTFPLIISKS